MIQTTTPYCSCRLFVYYQEDQHYTDYEYRSSLLGHVIRDEFWSKPVLHWHHLFMIPFEIYIGNFTFLEYQ